MIITRTPLSVSLFGDGSDLPAYFENHGPGCVVSGSIDRHVYVAIHRLGDDMVYVDTPDRPAEATRGIDLLSNPFVHAAAKSFRMLGGFSLRSWSDAYAPDVGLGGSSAFMVGLYHAVAALHGWSPPPQQLAHAAAVLEIETLQRPIGLQGHYSAAYGGLRSYEFNPGWRVTTDKLASDSVLTSELRPNVRDVDGSLFLIDTGERRGSGKILENYDINAQTLSTPDIGNIKSIAAKAQHVAYNPRYLSGVLSLGKHLKEAWALKRDMSTDIAPPRIRKIYDKAIKAGATGGQILGAGGGGRMLFAGVGWQQAEIAAALDAKPFYFKFEDASTGGSQVIYDDKRKGGG